MDGTFSTAPPQFSQFYTVRGPCNGKNIVGAYCLLVNKRMETYVELLSQIDLLTNRVVPESITTDFEQSMIGAKAQVYPLTLQRGCLFHLSKNIYRRVQELRLSHQYLNDAVFCRNIKMILALSFVNIADTIQAFDDLSNHAGVEEEAVLHYFKRNYIGELPRGTRLEPRYPHTLWNMAVRVYKNFPQANNNLEGWHNRFSSSFTHRHTHVWKFIDGLKQDKLMNLFKGWWLVTKIMTSSAFLGEYLTICHNGHHERTYNTV